MSKIDTCGSPDSCISDSEMVNDKTIREAVTVTPTGCPSYYKLMLHNLQKMSAYYIF